MKAEWSDVWHLVTAIVARQPPMIAILFAAGALFVIVMAVEGVRTSLLAIWRGHLAPPAPLAPRKPDPIALAAPAALSAPLSRGFTTRSVPRAAPRKRKVLTANARPFRTPRPKIQRRPMLETSGAQDLPIFTAEHAVFAPEGV